MKIELSLVLVWSELSEPHQLASWDSDFHRRQVAKWSYCLFNFSSFLCALLRRAHPNIRKYNTPLLFAHISNHSITALQLEQMITSTLPKFGKKAGAVMDGALWSCRERMRKITQDSRKRLIICKIYPLSMTGPMSFLVTFDGFQLSKLDAVLFRHLDCLLFFKNRWHFMDLIQLVLYAGWMSDIDMINYGFPPQLPWNGPVLYSFNGFVPSLVTGSKEAFEAVIDAFITLARNTTFALSTDINPFFSFPDGRVFTSDMLILRSRPELYLDLKFPTSIAGADVNRSLLLHFDKAEVRRWGLKYGLPALKCEAVRMIRNV